MRQRGESKGLRVRGNLTVEWKESKRLFVAVNEWNVVDATGRLEMILERGPVIHIPDDEWTERSLTRMARALAAETRNRHEEERDGVMRLI